MKRNLVRTVGLTLAVCILFVTAAVNGRCAPVKPTTIKLWALDGAETAVYQKMLPEIDKKYDSLNIEFSFYPNDEFYSKLQSALVVGDTPDIVIFDATVLPYYITAGMIAPLDKYFKKNIRKDMLKSVIDESTFNKKIYATAQFDSGMSFWANKSMLKEAGVRIPASYKDAWSKKEFEDALAKLKAKGVKYPLYLRQNSPKTLYYTYLPIVRSFGGDFMNRKTMLTKGALNSKATIAAYDYISWLIKMKYVNPLCDYEDGFYARKENALALVGHWKYQDHVKNLGDDAILVPLPNFGHGVYTGIGSVVWSITTTAQKRGIMNQCWEVLNQSITPEYITKMTEINGGIPSRISVLNHDPKYSKGGRLYLYREQLIDGIGYVRPKTPAHQQMYNTMKAVTQNIILGADPRTELEKASRDLDNVIKQNGWNRKL
jgi:multiple sugar transport system substrate-binding protein